jgi:membrane protein DedA with SNARE-associated domain
MAPGAQDDADVFWTEALDLPSRLAANRVDLKSLLGTGFAPLIAKYGYVATFVGTLFEGETFLVLSGLAASHGYLDIAVLFGLGAGSAFLTDNFFFAIGRKFGPPILARFPALAPSVARAHALVERLPNTAVIGIRFLYGMRSVGPAVIGAGSLAWSRFVILDALAASLWSVCWTSAGYLLGEVLAKLLEEFAQVGGRLLVGAALAIAVSLLFLGLRRRRVTRNRRSRL